MRTSTTARFTPSLLPASTLEALFVGRHDVLDAVMERVHAAATSSARNHTLLVGPRGSGKTHLVSLVAHRTSVAIQHGLKLQLAWLTEDLWLVDSLDTFLGEIVRAAKVETGGRSAESALRASAASNGPFVVVTENLDQTLDTLNPTDQQRLRHLLSSGVMLMVATTTRLTRDLSDQARPFYGFFTITRLDPFEVPTATEMLTRIAELSGDERMAEYLASPEGGKRLRVVEHLAGGAPRMWATLASALTVEQLDELVGLLTTRFDDLTPYYQEQLARLAPQQRRIVAALADLDRPMNVKALAEHLGIGEKSLAKSISELHERGWLKPLDSILSPLLDQRRTYYELAEPMARLAFQLKAARGTPIALIVDFLKLWFEHDDLETGHTSTDGARSYVNAAIAAIERDQAGAAALRIQGLPGHRIPVAETLAEVDRALELLQKGRPDGLLALAPALRSAIEAQLGTPTKDSILALRARLHYEALSETRSGDGAAVEGWLDRSARVVNELNEDMRASWQVVLITWLILAGRSEEAELLGSEISARYGRDHPIVYLTDVNIAVSYVLARRTDTCSGRVERILADSERSLGADDPTTVTIRVALAAVNRAQALNDHADGVPALLLNSDEATHRPGMDRLPRS